MVEIYPEFENSGSVQERYTALAIQRIIRSNGPINSVLETKLFVTIWFDSLTFAPLDEIPMSIDYAAEKHMYLNAHGFNAF